MALGLGGCESGGVGLGVFVDLRGFDTPSSARIDGWRTVGDPTATSHPGVDEHVAAHELARIAGDLLIELRAHSGLSGRDLSDRGDHLSQERLAAELATRFPDDKVRSEEGPGLPGAPRMWVVDPLDGSREYGEGRSDWAVHVALVVDGVPSSAQLACPRSGRCSAPSIRRRWPSPPPCPASSSAGPGRLPGECRGHPARRDDGAHGFRRRQDRCRGPRRGRHLHPRRRPIRVGLRRARRRGARRRVPRHAGSTALPSATAAPTHGCRISWCATRQLAGPPPCRSAVAELRAG